MPNWFIQFEVTGNHLSDAQAAVHTLRGVSNIGVRPIKESGPADIPRGNGLRKKALIVLAKVKTPMHVNDVLRVLSETGVASNYKKLSNAFNNMSRVGLVKRTKPSTFVITKKGVERVKAQQ